MILFDGERGLVIERKATYEALFGIVKGNLGVPEGAPTLDTSEVVTKGVLRIYEDGEARLESWLTAWRIRPVVLALKVVRDRGRDLYRERAFSVRQPDGSWLSQITRGTLEVFLPKGLESLVDLEVRFGKRRRSVYDTEAVCP